MKDLRIQKLAELVVGYSVELKEGERVLIETFGNAFDLTRAIIEEVYKHGGLPYLNLWDYKLLKTILKSSSKDQLQLLAERDLMFMKNMDAYIAIRAQDNISEWTNIPQEKLLLFSKIYQKPVHLTERCNNTKWCVLKYPTTAMAQLAGMGSDEFEDFYFNACLVDYSRMKKASLKLVELMEKTDKVRIVGPGTDIEFSIKGIPVVCLCGKHNIPDGEAFTAPIKDSVNGVVTFNVPSVREGYVFRDIKLKFRNGRVIEAEANDTDRLCVILDRDEGARYVGEFAIGFNSAILRPIGDTLFDEKIAGSFHIALGNSYDAAFNGNRSSIHWDLVSIQQKEYGGGEIYFDGILIRKDGLFVLEELQELNRLF